MKVMGSGDHPQSPLLLVLIVSSLISFGLADSIHGCGGFVEASSSLMKSRNSIDAKLDYSDISVELRTVDGLVRDRTQCAPNGYYFIPVYDKGVFVLKINGPEGWSWNPELVQVVVDDTGCNGNEDVNFRFTGFTLSGRILGAVGGESCLAKRLGPAGVSIELLYPDDELISTVTSSASGDYLFTNVIPGKYKVRASHPDMEIKIIGSTEVDVGFENGKMDDIFSVSGYDVRGSVVAQGNPILGVYVYLHSDDVQRVDCPHGSGDIVGSKKALCHAVSDADGMFAFKLIPCGKYDLVPYYKGENTLFDISPPVMSINVGHQHMTIIQKFQVTGFSVGGRVIDDNGNGVDSVHIIVDGQQRSITDMNGFYKIDQVTANQYTIEARKEHYRFIILNDYMVLPNMAAISDIKAISYDVCGVVRTIDPKINIKVALTHGPENVKPQAKQTDDTGKFCFEVSPGDYRLSAMAAGPESSPGLIFKPPHVDVSVKSPLLNLEFSQALVNVHGTVTCKEKCGPAVSVDLARMVGATNVVKKYTMTSENNNFVFNDVSPGKYQLKVKHSGSSDARGDDTWCWEYNSVDIDVGLEDVKGISFVQKGFWVHIVTSHDVDALLSTSDKRPLDLKLRKGSQRICVEAPGVHQIKFDNPCVFFGSSSFNFDPSDSSPLYLKAEKYLLSGQILLKSDGNHLPDHITVHVRSSDGSIIDSAKAVPASGGSEQASSIVYEYAVWSTRGEELTFAPVDPRSNGEKEFLFYPRLHQVKVTSDGCQAPIPPFSGREGLYLRGSVTPPVAGVRVKIVAAGNSPISSLQKDDTVFETTTAVDGSYIAGPFYDDISYEADASKPGYHLKRIGANSFSCQKLGQISVRVLGEPGAADPIPPLLLSLSGSDNYRNNSITGPGGMFVFGNLFPGVFYLRPLLKEYAFSPAAHAIEIHSGDFKEVTFQAKRVAYSAMGVVTVLSGQPVEGVTVEARSHSKGFYEETNTDPNGHFKLRGLHPHTSYAVKVVQKDAFQIPSIERTSPESVTIQVGDADLSGLDFVIFEKPETTLLTCHVEGENKRNPRANMMVEIKSAADASTVESVIQLPPSNFFQVRSLPAGKHTLQVRPNFPLSGLEFESDVIEVDLEKEARIHVGPLKYRLKEAHHKQDAAPAPVLPLIVGVSVIALFISMPRIKELYQSAGAIPKKPIVRKKTY